MTAALRRVVLHVGAPKSGTTYLQRVLWANRDALLDAGYLVPGRSGRDMFHAAIQVRGAHRQWGMDRESLAGTWEGLCAEARAFPGTTVMSHEVLAAATRPQAAAALEELRGLELHLVFSARDLVRQVLSEWQERVKNGSTVTFGAFAQTIAQQAGRGGGGGSFWRYQDAQSVFDRWGRDLPRPRLHLVVAPRSGASPDELWLRFAAALGLDGHRFSANLDAPANQTLGVTQTAVLRKVNQALDGRIVQPEYARIVKRQFAQRTLAAHASPRPVCPPELVTPLRAISERWVEEIAQRGWTVHGDLAELLPDPSTNAGTSDAPHPDDVDPASEAALAETVIADLLVERLTMRETAGRRTRRSRGAGTEGGPPASSGPSTARAAMTGLLTRSRDLLRNRSGR